MEKVLHIGRLPIKLWLNEIEDGAMKQAINLANLPFAFNHIVIMPDCHQGYGMPIGGVLATKGVVIPNAVGVDIGCGMSAVRTSLNDINISRLRTIMYGIRDLVPLGFKHHKKSRNPERMPEGESMKIDDLPVVSREYNSALYQLGTLGGGNHFIEIQKGSDGFIWLMVHSGSRNIGKQVADHYNNLAMKLNDKWGKSEYRKWQLAYLPENSDEGIIYWNEMQFCIDFAFANRQLMIDNILSVFINEYGEKIKFAPLINIAHNYASREKHFGEQVIVHRKGATRAKKGQTGIIPGSQGTNSYIVRGKGNKDSFESCSHGAGRVMGRKQAQRSLDLSKEIKDLDKKNILHSLQSKKDLDEAPSAYKDIKEVMKNQSDLVEILVELTPMAVIKG
ncbi:MAG: RtcB family protein [Bacteroidetes bacterium]|nr:RtcB family protein [Bacteroidota bacterium]